MSLNIQQKADRLIFSLATEDVVKRVESGVVDMVMTRLADEFMRQYGEAIAYQIANLPGFKEEIQTIIKERVIHESANQVQK